MADLIPRVRGINYTINDCLVGDEEKPPVPTFKKLISQYEGLLEACLKIEGLISGVGIHASGVAITNEPYIKQVSLMKAPNGTNVTAFDLEDCEQAGIIKYDMLTVSTLDEIHATMELLLKDGQMEWQGSLRDTYNKYLHPDVLDYTTPEMFAMLGTNKASNVFQLSTDMSTQACKLLKPKSLMEMTLVNSVIRLVSESGKESPTQKYVRYKNDINEWYKDLQSFGITEEEKNTLEKYLSKSSGLCLSQETLMLMAMDKKISGMTLKETEGLRKGLAKKKQELVEQSKIIFYNRGVENGVRKEMLDYVWNEQFALSLSYSFALSHGIAYSAIGLQQLNLLYHYPPIYSQCATLLVNSSSTEDNEGDKVDYGKIARAAFTAKQQGISFDPCDINLSLKGFSPNKETNSILCGLKNISGINTELGNKIISNRAYSSLHDFVTKNPEITKTQMYALIKSGCFDKLENKDRAQIVNDYLNYLFNLENPVVTQLTAKHLEKMAELKLIPQNKIIFLQLYNFNKYITNKQFVYEKRGNKVWLIAKDIARTFFEQNYINNLTEGNEYEYTSDGIIFLKSAYNKIYQKRFNQFIADINTADNITMYNNSMRQIFVNQIKDKYFEGEPCDWEMDTLSFYYKDNPLNIINTKKYLIESFNNLPIQPVEEGKIEWGDKVFSKYSLSRIIGTVIDSDRMKKNVTIVTNDDEIVTVKMYDNQFIFYNKVIKTEDGDKEESWFSVGNKIMFTGYRRDDQFIPKVYKDSVYQYPVCLITNIYKNGNIDFTHLRLGQKEKRY